MSDKTKKPVMLTAKQLAGRVGRTKQTITAWRKGARGEPGGRVDQLGDPYLEGEWIKEPGQRSELYTTGTNTDERIAVLAKWLTLSAPLKAPPGPRKRAGKTNRLPPGKKLKPPPYIKQGGNRGNEYVMPDDLMRLEDENGKIIYFEHETLGPCALIMRNRGWLYVWPKSENCVKRVRATEKLIAELTELNVPEFWPFSAEDALRLVYGHEFPKPEEGGDK